MIFRRSRHPTAIAMAYPQPPNRATITLMLCLMGMISLVHFRLGLCRLRNSPKQAENTTYSKGNRKIRSAVQTVGRRTITPHSEQRKTGIAVRIT